MGIFPPKVQSTNATTVCLQQFLQCLLPEFQIKFLLNFFFYFFKYILSFVRFSHFLWTQYHVNGFHVFVGLFYFFFHLRRRLLFLHSILMVRVLFTIGSIILCFFFLSHSAKIPIFNGTPSELAKEYHYDHYLISKMIKIKHCA